MIEFNCHCAFHFELPEDQAGGLIQCPKCGRLNDIPTLSDVDNLEDGGIYKVEPVPDNPDLDLPAVGELLTRDRQDEFTGEDYDMRPDVETILNAGEDAPPYDLAGELPAQAPKYDPETGELIEPLAVKPDALRVVPIDASKIPMAKTALGYAGKDAETLVDTGARIFIQLFKPMNLFVMTILFVMHLILMVTSLVALSIFFFLIPVAFLLLTAIVSHFGCVVDETGPTNNSELPRPMRNLSWHDDLWGPGMQIYAAIIVCYFPIPLAFMFGISDTLAGQGLILTTVMFGTFLFPAAVLTSLTSGTYVNLRYDRLLGVMKVIGPRYLMLVLVSLAAAVVYFGGCFLTLGAFATAFRPVVSHLLMALGALGALAAMFAGIFAIHWVGWYLGILYRRWHDKFPWVMQRHISTRRDTQKQLEAFHRRTARKKRLAQQQAATNPPLNVVPPRDNISRR